MRADTLSRKAMEGNKNPRRYPRIREASFEDYAQITSLASLHGLGTRSYEEWTHLWTDNPACRLIRERWPIGWVLEDENRRILGSVGNVPHRTQDSFVLIFEHPSDGPASSDLSTSRIICPEMGPFFVAPGCEPMKGYQRSDLTIVLK